MSDYNKSKEFMTYFKTYDRFRDNIATFFAGKYKIDIIKFNDWCRDTQGYKEEETGSLSEFVRNKFGKSAEDFISSLF